MKLLSEFLNALRIASYFATFHLKDVQVRQMEGRAGFDTFDITGLKCYRPVYLERNSSINNGEAKQTDPAEHNTPESAGFEV